MDKRRSHPFLGGGRRESSAFGNKLTTATGAITAPGWYEFDFTTWYNARLGQITTVLMRGSQVSGSDFPILEDRENTAFLNGSVNTISATGPRLVVVVPEPASLALVAMVALRLMVQRRRS